MTEMLRFPAPRCDSARELNQLLDDRRAVAERVAEVESAGTTATREVNEASTALVALERRAATGEDVSDSIKRTERHLSAARTKAAQPWPERARGLRAGLRDHDNAVSRHINERWDELADELGAEADAVAHRVDDALRELEAAYRARQGIARRADALIAAAVGRSRPGLVPASKVQAVVDAAEAALLGGGEAAPAVTDDPRKPRAGMVVAEFHEEAWS